MGSLRTRITGLFLAFGGIVLAVLLGYSALVAQQASASSDKLLVQTLAPELESVRLGRMEELTREQSRKVAALEGIGFRFQSDLNADGRQDLVLLGDYVDNKSHRSFVLIATEGPGGWARSQLFTFDEGFVIGRENAGQFLIFFCTGCDYGGRIEWTGSDYRYTPFRPAGVQ